ncbi:MAG: hypothetical protein V1977_03080 [Candidatus Diapherotrites archaeon]
MKEKELIRNLESTNAAIRQDALSTIDHQLSKREMKAVMTRFNDDSFWVRKQAARVLEIFGGVPFAELYGKHILDEDMSNAGKKIVRRTQEKIEKNTILLGGGLKGKALIKMMKTENVAAWLRLLSAGVSVEPILKDKSGRFRIYKLKNGDFRVYSGVLKGPTLSAFLKNPANRKFKERLESQKKEILSKAKALNVEHGHAYDWNFIVLMDKNSEKRNSVPKLYLFDFDKAFVRKN